MQVEKDLSVITVTHILPSKFLGRKVIVDCYYPAEISHGEISLLLINDGQDLPKMPFDEILDVLFTTKSIEPLFCVGLHCSADRKNEYGTAKVLDYKGRGAKALAYSFFVMQELLPFLRREYNEYAFTEKNFAGFSLGGLCALDIVWNFADHFTHVGVFSGSLWWRDKSQEDADFDEDNNRIMHRQIREGEYKPWLRFFFETGTQDEKGDRNKNGIIDSIDDTLTLIAELTAKGYDETNITYLELKDGRHDVPTWANAFPAFLISGWGKKGN